MPSINPAVERVCKSLEIPQPPVTQTDDEKIMYLVEALLAQIEDLQARVDALEEL